MDCRCRLKKHVLAVLADVQRWQHVRDEGEEVMIGPRGNEKGRQRHRRDRLTLPITMFSAEV